MATITKLTGRAIAIVEDSSVSAKVFTGTTVSTVVVGGIEVSDTTVAGGIEVSGTVVPGGIEVSTVVVGGIEVCVVVAGGGEASVFTVFTMLTVGIELVDDAVV